MKGSTKSITKQFMNPTRKYYNSKRQNKTFVEPKTPTEKPGAKRVYESHSTSRSGGTGEPNYMDLKKTRDFSMLSSLNNKKNLSGNKSSLENGVLAKKVTNLTKENNQIRRDYEKVRKEMEKMEKSLKVSRKEVEEKDKSILEIRQQVVYKEAEIEKMKIQFKTEREADQKIVAEYINAENYLLELVDEFTNGMRKIYANDIEFKDVDIQGLPF